MKIVRSVLIAKAYSLPGGVNIIAAYVVNFFFAAF